METSPAPPPFAALSTQLYYQLVYTLSDLLPPPVDASPEALRTRNHAAIAKVAALLPVNANEADLAAQCIAARAQAEDLLRLLRQHTDDINLIIRLNAQYSSMVRTSLSVHARLMRVQAVRQKRDAIEATANQDAWTLHVAERSMLQVTDPPTERPKPAPRPEPVETPAVRADQAAEQKILEMEQNFIERDLRRRRDGAGEPETEQSREAELREIARQSLAAMGFGSGKSPANGRESLARAP